MAEHPNLTAALAAAQAEYPTIIKGSVNPHFKSHYADLADGMGPIRPILAKHGIAYTQTFHVVDGTLILRTSLRHGSETVDSELPITQPPKPQDFIALTTYYRRVGLFSLVGITPANEDDDGEQANSVATTQAPPRRSAPPPSRPRPVETPEAAVVRADREAADRDPWKLSAANPDAVVDLMLIAIDSRDWPEVERAMAGYRSFVRDGLTAEQRKVVTDAYVARREMVRADNLAMAG